MIEPITWYGRLDPLEPPSIHVGWTRESGLTCSCGSPECDHPEQLAAAVTLAVKAAEKTRKSEIKIEAAVDAAGGVVYPLPAVVNRAGTVVPVPLEVADSVLEGYLRAGDLTVDVEHTGYPIGHKDYRLKTVQLGGPDLAVVLDPWPEQDGQRGLIRNALAEAERLHAHVATADLAPLDHAGLLVQGAEEAWSRMYDTVIPLKLTQPTSVENGAGLKELSAHLLGERAVSPAADEARAKLFAAGKWLTEVKPNTPITRSGWAQVDSGSVTMLRYAASDVLDTALLAQEAPEVSQGVLERERGAQRLTARVTHRGVALDAEHVEAKHVESTAAKAVVAERLRERWGIENGASAPQVLAAAKRIEFPLGRTKPTKTYPEGRESAAKGTLEPFQMDQGIHGEFARDVLEHREHVNRLGLFLDPYRVLVRHGDGRARPTIYTLGADTGRMSCARPNLQQVPREGGFRACITADSGQLLVSADFAGVELRVAAALAQDPELYAIVTAGRNLHLEVAKMVFGPDTTKSSQAYYAVKSGVFAWLYGSGPETMATAMKAPVEKASSVRDTLTRMLPRTVEWTREVKAFVQSGGREIPTYSGRTIVLDPTQPHKAPNYAIQGTARELLIDALFRWDQAMPGEFRPIVLPVHDELVTMVPESAAEQATTLLVQCMTTELYGVPIKAEPSEPSFAWQDSV